MSAAPRNVRDVSRLRRVAARHNDAEAAIPARDVALVAFGGVEAIDVAGPASIFSKAEAMHPGSYRVHVAWGRRA